MSLAMVVCLMLLGFPLLAGPAPAPRFATINDPLLRSLSVNHLLQDRQGFIWLATGNGLYRYDGYQSIPFRNAPGDARTLPGNIVTSLFEDGGGRLWVGTTNGLARFNAETNDFTAYSPAAGPAKYRNLRIIADDRQGGMWIGTWGGLQHFNPRTGEFRQFVQKPGQTGQLADNNVNALAVDEHGGLWVGLWQNGLDYLAPGTSTFKHFPRIDSERQSDPQLNTARTLLLDRRGRLWIGTEAGVVVWRTGTDWSSRERLPAAPGLQQPRIGSLFEDRDGSIWMGSITDGLARWDADGHRFLFFQRSAADPDSLSSHAIRSLMQDRQGILWIGSAGEGIARLNLSSQGFSRYLPEDPSADRTASNRVRALAGENAGQLWVGALNGLQLLDLASRKVVRSFRAQPDRPGALGSNTIYSLYRSPEGRLWIGTMNGLYMLEKGRGSFRHFPFGAGATRYINMIRPGSGGTLWLVTGTGVIHFNPGTGAAQTYRHDPSDPGSRSTTATTDVHEDRKGRVWMVDQDGGGLDMLDVASGRFSNFRFEPGGGRATRLHEDGRGDLWIATASGLLEGEVQADGGLRFRSFENRNGLPFTAVYSLEEDAAGHIWLTNDIGISRFDPDGGSFLTFTAADGITENFGNCLSYADPRGELFFASVHGITGVTPEAVRVNLQPPQVAITDISIFNKSLHGGMPGSQVRIEGSSFEPRAFKLSWRESVFAIEFSAMQFDAPELTRFAYRLEGFDRDWVETDARHRLATYTNLNPGRYLFRVKAANSKGVWNETGISLPITISPPFWRTWWFRLLALASLLGSATMLVRMRIRRLLRQKKKLEKLVVARTAELEESNNRLALLSMTDGLTGIANRRRFDEALASEWNRAKRARIPIAVAMVDVDWFKKYNDHYGHQAGDECLRQVAQAFAAQVRRAGDLAARYGGEEFALIAPGSEGSELLTVARSICQAMEQLALPHDLSPFGRVTVSIGVASVLPTEQDCPDQLLKKADEALYLAKEAGRNRAAAG